MSDKQKVSFGLIAPAVLNLPLYIAERKGFLGGHGVEASWTICGTTDATTEAVRTGAVNIIMNSPEGSVANCIEGGPLRLIGALANQPPLSLVARPGFTRIEELRGRRIGTSSLKEGTCHLVQLMLGKHGLRYPGDFEFVLAGAHPQRWVALQAGTIDAALQLLPFDMIAEDAGYTNLGRADDYVPEFSFAAIAGRADWLADNASLAARVMRGMLDATAWFYDHPQEAAQIASTETRTPPEFALRACERVIARNVIPRDLRVTQPALDQTVEAMRASGQISADCLIPADAFDPQWLQRAAAGKL
jgi:ABC-type nitrate/sulfonate/bicarbonate transport system substrate-binding protein